MTRFFIPYIHVAAPAIVVAVAAAVVMVGGVSDNGRGRYITVIDGRRGIFHCQIIFFVFWKIGHSYHFIISVVLLHVCGC